MQTRLVRPLLTAVVAGGILACGAAFAGPAVAGQTPATVDKTAPTGTFKLDYTSAWLGQTTTLTLVGVADNKSPSDKITKVVTWGDGTTSRLLPTQTSVSTQYHTVGKFPVTLTLTDQAGNAAVVKSSVVVSPPAKFALSAGSLYLGQQFSITISAVPAGTTGITLNYGNGDSTTVAGKDQTLSGLYYTLRPDGTRPGSMVALTAAFTSKDGTTAPYAFGRIAIKADLGKPTVTITTPANPTHVSSWTTLRGTATDQGSGVHFVRLSLIQGTGGHNYCYTADGTWLLMKPASTTDQCGVSVGVSNGQWSLTLSSLAKGVLSVGAVAADWYNNVSVGTVHDVVDLTAN